MNKKAFYKKRKTLESKIDLIKRKIARLDKEYIAENCPFDEGDLVEIKKKSDKRLVGIAEIKGISVVDESNSFSCSNFKGFAFRFLRPESRREINFDSKEMTIKKVKSISVGVGGHSISL